MTIRATEKIIDALIQLLEGYAELQDTIENEYGEGEEEDVDDDAEEDEKTLTPDAALVSEVRASIEAAMEAEDYTPEEVANLIASMTEALEEIDPNVFDDEESSEKEEEEDDDDDADYDDDDDDDDDIDLDDDDYEDYEEEEEEDD